MASKIRMLVLLGISLIVAWTGWSIYSYFFSQGAPLLLIAGIEPEGSYAGDVPCCVKGKDNYKVRTISIAIDGKPLVSNFRISKKEFEHPFTIPTKALSNGKHTLTVEAQNGTYHKEKTAQEILLYVDNVPLQAAFVKGAVDAKVFQGRTLHIQFQANKQLKSACVHVFSKTYPCYVEAEKSFIYECFIPVDCEQLPNEYLLTIEIEDKVGNKMTLETKFQVVMFPFKKQSLKISPEKIKAEEENSLPEQKLEEELEELSKKSPCKKLWQGAFCMPIEYKSPKQITTEFGVIRTTQYAGLKQHKAVDLYGTPKSVVWAPQDGVVIIKNRYAHSGNTVVIDHGCSIFTLFFHLDSFAPIEVGQKIKKGNPLGTIGQTGRATGYHLHEEMRIHNIAVDPLEWTKQDF